MKFYIYHGRIGGVERMVGLCAVANGCVAPGPDPIAGIQCAPGPFITSPTAYALALWYIIKPVAAAVRSSSPSWSWPPDRMRIVFEPGRVYTTFTLAWHPIENSIFRSS